MLVTAGNGNAVSVMARNSNAVSVTAEMVMLCRSHGINGYAGLVTAVNCYAGLVAASILY